MKNLLLAVSLAVSVGFAFAGGVADVPWTQANADPLTQLNKPAVVELLNDLWQSSAPVSVPEESEIGEFMWADLAGNGTYQLVTTRDVNGRAFFNALSIYRRSVSGKIRCQELRGWMIHDLHNVIRDLNGDGRDELIIPTVLMQYSTAGTFT